MDDSIKLTENELNLNPIIKQIPCFPTSISCQKDVEFQKSAELMISRHSNSSEDPFVS